MSKGTDTPDLSRNTGRLLLMMRRLVKEEFSVTIHLGDDGALDELRAFADRSRNSLLRQMSGELKTLVNTRESEISHTADAPSAAPTYYYRGAPLPANSNENLAQPEPRRETPARDGLVYRGRVVR